jgi:hypothetical protein
MSQRRGWFRAVFAVPSWITVDMRLLRNGLAGSAAWL